MNFSLTTIRRERVLSLKKITDCSQLMKDGTYNNMNWPKWKIQKYHLNSFLGGASSKPVFVKSFVLHDLQVQCIHYMCSSRKLIEGNSKVTFTFTRHHLKGSLRILWYSIFLFGRLDIFYKVINNKLHNVCISHFTDWRDNKRHLITTPFNCSLNALPNITGHPPLAWGLQF